MHMPLGSPRAGLVEGAVVAVAMQRERDFLEVVRALARFCATQRSQLDASLGGIRSVAAALLKA